MPVYEYRCRECGSVSEFLVSRIGGQPENLACSQCGGKQMDKALSAMAVHAAAAGSPCQSGACPVPPGQRSCCGGRCNL